jgi:hypothetical protein
MLFIFGFDVRNVETAMGYKSGESRSLMEQKERETKMVLPNPTSLGTLGPILQVCDFNN